MEHGGNTCGIDAVDAAAGDGNEEVMLAGR
jgi:hypothetical protein